MTIAKSVALVGLLMGLMASSRADGAFTVTFAQVGNNVVATGTGSLNLTGVTNLGETSINDSQIDPGTGLLKLGSADFETVYRPYFAKTTGFGSDVYHETTFGTGYHVGFLASGALYLSTVYVSGTQITSTATFANTTIAGLGLTAGTYSYAYSATQGGPTLDTITIQVAPSTVPEPASLALLGLGLLSLALRRRRAS